MVLTKRGSANSVNSILRTGNGKSASCASGPQVRQAGFEHLWRRVYADSCMAQLLPDEGARLYSRSNAVASSARCVLFGQCVLNFSQFS